MEILFLGHQSTHHNSEEYLPYLASALTPKGINFTYADDPDVLNAEYLDQFDGLALYANHDEITSSQEKALLEFVKDGGAFIPIHCASYCFRNSNKFVKLVGGQFESHDTATFQLETLLPEHPVMEGLDNPSFWDETYVHTKHSKKTVLQERVEGDHREPFTWVKTFGKGRVFYTALGHDLRTWGHPGFHDLLYNGIMWALGDSKKNALTQLDFPNQQYSTAKIPNYEKRDPAPQLQAPLPPEESMKLIQVPPGFELQLFASEPDILKPIAMNWDHRGRLWILESVDYPNEINTSPGVGNDRIKILEDTDGDGRADRFTVFADQLSVPTSLVFANDGVIVAQAPNFLFFKDEDGDDKADVREVIMEGWGTYDTHAGPSNLRYGFDNKIWGTVGYSGFEGNVSGVDHDFYQAIYRFDSDGSNLEMLSRTSNNTWGLGFTENFDVFASTANNTHSAFFGIPDAHLKDVAGIYLQGAQKIDGHYLFHPITRNFRQVDVFGGFTAAAGHAFYTARTFPEEYWNRTALVCEPTGHLLHRAIIEPEGAGFQERDGWNLMASSDEWVSPVAAETGPDGAIWVLDWYNFIIQHNPTPEGFENGPGNAHVNPLRDKQHGRIYRIVPKGAEKSEQFTLSKDDPEALIKALTSDNLFWRLGGQRLLVERGNDDVKSKLIAMVDDQSMDDLNMNTTALHALWTLQGLTDENDSQFRQVVLKSLNHPAWAIRKAAIQILPNTEETLELLQDKNCFGDKNDHVKLAAYNKLWELPTTEALADLLVELSQANEVLEDLWLSRAIYLASVKHQDAFTIALLKSRPNLLAELAAQQDQKIDYTNPDLNTEDWGDIEVPKWIGHTGIEALSGFSGVFWYRKVINLTADQIKQRISFNIPGASNQDSTFVNGVLIGTGRGWNNERRYTIPGRVLQPGKNVIAMRIRAGGGMGGDPEKLYLQIGGQKQNIAGTDWKYKIQETITSGRSEYADGEDIVSLFLKHYGPNASKDAQDNLSDQIVDKKFVVKTIQDQMKYDIEELFASPGDVIEIQFENNDRMQHNLLVIEPGSLTKVGLAGEEFAKQQNAAELGYKPDLTEILYATPLLNPGENYSLIFKLPEEPGDYPYVCTFPGHWQTMNGVIRARGEVQ